MKCIMGDSKHLKRMHVDEQLIYINETRAPMQATARGRKAIGRPGLHGHVFERDKLFTCAIC